MYGPMSDGEDYRTVDNCPGCGQWAILEECFHSENQFYKKFVCEKCSKKK